MAKAAHEGSPSIIVNVPPDRTKLVDWLQFGVNLLLAAAAFLAIGITRQQLVGTEAAVLADYSVNFDANGLHVGLTNEGHVTLTRIHLRIDAKEVSLESKEQIGDALHLERDVEPLREGKGFSADWTLP
jgi:hypothetical protein